MTGKDSIYANQIEVKDFTFDANVVEVFPDMIQRSVPGYATIVSTMGKLAGQFAIDTNIAEEDGLHKLRLGPLEDDTHAQSLLENLQAGEFRQAFLLYSEQRL